MGASGHHHLTWNSASTPGNLLHTTTSISLVRLFLISLMTTLLIGLTEAGSSHSKERETLPKPDLKYFMQLSNRKRDYVMYWDYDDKEIVFEVHVKTRGWVGFGLANNRNMLGADIVIGWVDNSGRAHLHDYYSTNFSRPTLDVSQDWTLLEGRQTNSYTLLKFSRKLVTCDPRDNDVRNDTMGVIWSYYPEDPIDQYSMLYHGKGRRGGRSIQLLTSSVPSPRGKKDMPRDAFNIDFSMPNVLLPPEDTIYLCHAFPVPRLGQKHHVIQVDPILQRPHSGLVHHMILYGCYHDIEISTVNTPTECYKHNISPMLTLCNAVFAGWAIGGQTFVMPEYAGLPLGDSAYPSMMMLEIHYDNKDGRADLRDSSGVRLWLTSRLRHHDAAFLQTGVLVDGFQALPPQAPNFRSQGHCLPECLSQVMRDQPEGIRVFGALLHTHLSGVAVRVRHFRNGHELPHITADEHYDFNYQETRVTPNEINVLPGDHLVTECTYKTNDRVIWGGLSTKEEMCIAYLLYYPAIPLANCDSRPTKTSALSFIHAQFARSGEVISPPEFQGQTYRDVLSRMSWNDVKRKAYQTAVTSGQVLAQCKMGSIEYPANYRKTDIPKMLTEWHENITDTCKTLVKKNTSASSLAVLNTLSRLNIILSFTIILLSCLR